MDREALEVEIANAVSHYHYEQQGRAPSTIRVSFSGNIIFAITTDVFTPCEQDLHTTEDGRKLIKSARRELRSLTRDRIHADIARIIGCPVLRSYWDLDVRVGEQMEAYVLSADIESCL